MKLRNRIKEIAESSRACPHQILVDTVTPHAVDVRAVVGNPESVKRAIRRHKRGNRPKQPTSLQELQITGDWATTGGVNAQPFVIHDSGQQADGRIIVFATDECLIHLGRSNQWLMDGTFSTAPALFQQLYVIRAALGDTTIACVYAFMTSKSQEMYVELFRAINVKCQILGFDLDPVTIMTDFEQAVFAAIAEVYGSDVRKTACFYHLTQSTWRKVQELGLVPRYKNDADVRHFCGMIDGLAFLPVHDVQPGLAYLKTIVTPELVPLLDYFDQTYVSGPLRTLHQPGDDSAHLRGLPALRMRRSKPLFPPELWNVNEATLNDTARTNNMCEAWNNGFRTTVGHDHPCVWTAIDAIRKDQAMCSTMLYQNDHGQPPAKRIRRESTELQKRLKKLCIEYREGGRDIKEFIRAVGHCIRFF